MLPFTSRNSLFWYKLQDFLILKNVYKRHYSFLPQHIIQLKFPLSLSFLFIFFSFLLSFVLLLYYYPPRIAPLIVGNIIVNVVYIE